MKEMFLYASSFDQYLRNWVLNDDLVSTDMFKSTGLSCDNKKNNDYKFRSGYVTGIVLCPEPPPPPPPPLPVIFHCSSFQLLENRKKLLIDDVSNFDSCKRYSQVFSQKYNNNKEYPGTNDGVTPGFNYILPGYPGKVTATINNLRYGACLRFYYPASAYSSAYILHLFVSYDYKESADYIERECLENIDGTQPIRTECLCTSSILSYNNVAEPRS